MNPTDRILTGAEPDADAHLIRDIRDAQPYDYGIESNCPACSRPVAEGEVCFNCEGDA